MFVADELEIEEYYPVFLDMVKNVLDGNMESTAYEDTLRDMFGIHAYVAFTLDKVVTYAVRQVNLIFTLFIFFFVSTLISKMKNFFDFYQTFYQRVLF